MDHFSVYALFFSFFVSIFLHTVFTSSDDTTFKFFRGVAVTPGPIPSYHLPPKTSGTRNFCHHLPGWITCHLEWERIRRSSLCVSRPSYRLRNKWIIGHLEWEHIHLPVLSVGRPSSCLCNIYPQIYHLLLGQYFVSKNYRPTASRERLGRSKGEHNIQ